MPAVSITFQEEKDSEMMTTPSAPSKEEAFDQGSYFPFEGWICHVNRIEGKIISYICTIKTDAYIASMTKNMIDEVITVTWDEGDSETKSTKYKFREGEDLAESLNNLQSSLYSSLTQNAFMTRHILREQGNRCND